MNPVLKVENLQKFCGNKGAVTKAVDRISFEVEKGEYIESWGIREWKNNASELYFHDRPCDGGPDIHNHNVTNLKRESAVTIQKRKTGIYISEF